MWTVFGARAFTRQSMPRCVRPSTASRIVDSVMKRLGLTGKRFLAILAAAAAVVAMGAAAHWGFERLFIGCLNEQAVERMAAALPPGPRP